MKRFLWVLPLVAVLLVALGIAYLTISVDAPMISIVPFSHEDETEIMMNVFFILIIASLSSPFLYLTLKKGWISLLEKMFAVGGGFLTLFLTGVLSMHLFRMYPSFFMFFQVWLCIFFITLSIAFTIAGVFSEGIKNVIFMTYSSVSGSFLGMGIPTFSMVYILFFLCIIDLLYYRAGLLKKIVNISKGRAIFVRLRYSDRELFIGLGDLTYYSMLAAHSFVNFGITTAIFSTFLTLAGWNLTSFLTKKTDIFPGLPIPLGLGLIPIIADLAF